MNEDNPKNGEGLPSDLEPFAPFKVLKRERVYDSVWCALDRDEIELEDGSPGEYHVFRIPDAIVVVPITSDGLVAMIWQHRHPHGKTHWEVPAGRLNEGEPPVEAAHRELLEETGLKAGELIPLANFYPINGISDHLAHAFVATGCSPAAELNLDPAERLIMRPRPLEVVRAELLAGRFQDGFTALALFQALAYLDAR